MCVTESLKMANPLASDNVYTSCFTPREYQVELLDAARERNIIVCLGSPVSKAFISIKLVQEFSRDLRSGKKRAVHVTNGQNVHAMALCLRHLTDLEVAVASDVTDAGLPATARVLVLTPELFEQLTSRHQLQLVDLNLLVLDECHALIDRPDFNNVMTTYNTIPLPSRPRILALTSSLFEAGGSLSTLEASLERLEMRLHATAETASDIVTLLRYSHKPAELIVLCAPPVPFHLGDQLLELVTRAQTFLTDHRFDPSETYDNEFQEELKQIPDPKHEPQMVFNDFLTVLDQLGPWAADRAAFVLLMRIEKLKIRTPYERHYLLLCMAASVLLQVRCLCDEQFDGMEELERIEKFSTHRVQRLIELFQQLRPPSSETTVLHSSEEPTTPVKVPPVVVRGNSRSSRRSGGGRGPRVRPPSHYYNNTSPDALCGIVFVSDATTARVLFYLLCELSRHEPRLAYLSVQYAVEKVAPVGCESREAEHRSQEEVLKKFRMHECNLLVATAILEEGIDVPRCNLVVHFDPPHSFRSYVFCKGRARAAPAHHVFFVEQPKVSEFLHKLAEYRQIESIVLRKCANQEPCPDEETAADGWTSRVAIYRPNPSKADACVTLATSIALLNRYCARLPSDTFTRLTPIWRVEVMPDGRYRCSLRLPINSPLKQTIYGRPMTSCVLARRMAALRACAALHRAGELDDNLMPIGKEGFRAAEPDWDCFMLDADDEALARDCVEMRPGTTKRRQYYTKRIAETLLDCKPCAGEPAYLYHIRMTLTCPLPEEQNTRGRRIYPPEDSPQGFGILTRKRVPKICPFPIFTRSGEVSVELELASEPILLTAEQLVKIRDFLNYMFTNVLRLEKYLMVYDPDESKNSYFVVPVLSDPTGGPVTVDWKFLDRIYESRDLRPHTVEEDVRKEFRFQPSRYQDAVVMPWYRNQDQPQYFYVAEICYQLSPKSSFPGADYNTFEEYYLEKYAIQIQNCRQPLLDVDHTSARLNFLTPRYVNRKGVALPTSSEETKRAKRENLEHKQILVPELCTVHPFPASLWRKAVCLPCVLYRVNALLLADEIRRELSAAVGLGRAQLDDNFRWPPLDFGWSLAAVLKKSNEAKQEPIKPTTPDQPPKPLTPPRTSPVPTSEHSRSTSPVDEEKDWMEIGTWSNEMADNCTPLGEPGGFTGVEVRYGSPTSMLHTYNSYSDDGLNDYSGSDDDSMDLDDSDDETRPSALRIEFKGENTAEAFDKETPPGVEEPEHLGPVSTEIEPWNVVKDNHFPDLDKHLERFNIAVEEHKSEIVHSGIILDVDAPIIIEKWSNKNKHLSNDDETIDNSDLIQFDLTPEEECAETSEIQENGGDGAVVTFEDDSDDLGIQFRFDEQPDLDGHPGPSPSVILQALTMSNANDGINLERLETIGDSFLKYAITTYLYCTYENVHEGKLSHLRSKQVSNLNLYRLGRKKHFGESMIATKFEPHDNWLPPCYYVPTELEQALIDARVPAIHWTQRCLGAPDGEQTTGELVRRRGEQFVEALYTDTACLIPYNLLTQQSIPDKSIADCVEALIGAYLIECGPRGALLFMAWLGIRVLPLEERTGITRHQLTNHRLVGSLEPVEQPDGTYVQTIYGELQHPRSPLLRHVANPEGELERLLDGYNEFERIIHYRFRDRSYLLQALTHASYFPNRLTDCYQRLEFLGDAVLDYLITRHLYEDARQHSPGALTDLRSALVNNTIFASLAVRHGFHKYFRHLSPGLHEIIDRFVRIQEANGHMISEEYYLTEDDDQEEAEDVEVPKALGDVFESVAGAVFLDSRMSLDAVWRVYFRMMRAEIELFSTHVPKSPIRELLELEPETAKFSKPEKLADGRRVRVSVEVFGKGTFKGIGRNYRIAKCTAAKCALKQLRLKYGLTAQRK